MRRSNVNRQYVEAGFILQVLLYPGPATFLYSQPLSLSQPNYTGLFEHPLPTTNPHNHHDCQYRTKTPCYYNPREEMGARRELIYV